MNDRLLTFRSKLKAPISPLRQILIAIFGAASVSATSVFGQWYFNVYHRLPRMWGVSLIGPMLTFLVTAGLIGVLQYRSHQRRKASLARAQVVADCNHEIRNALQGMMLMEHPEQTMEQIRASVQRIDWALRDVLPHVQDGDESDAPDIYSQWLRTKGQLLVQ